MLIAIFSDLHDNFDALHQVLEDTSRQKVDRYLCLGDVGRDERLFAELHRRQIPCIYGNWEVSGLRRMNDLLQGWVAGWHSKIYEGEAVYAHATPDMPAAAATTAEAVRYMQSGIGWRALFPRLHTDEEARWQAFAALEEANLRVAFHGHTHVQQVWTWETNASNERHLRSITGTTEFTLHTGDLQKPNRYLIGVGSVGQPNDGVHGRYVIYDPQRGVVQLKELA